MAQYIVFGILLIFLIFLSGLFSFSEMAISSSNRTRLLTIIDSEKSSDRKKQQARKVINFMDKYNEHITAIVIFNNIVNIMFSTLATVFFTLIAIEVWDHGAAGALLSFVVTTPLVIVFGEIIPKQLAKKHPETGTMALSTTIVCVNIVMKPLTLVLGKIIKEEEQVAFNSDAEINTALSQATEAGVTTEYEQSMIKKLLSADEILVESIMIPLDEVVTIKSGFNQNKLDSLIKDTSHTRFPVLNNEGEVVSILSIKHYLLDRLRDDVHDLSSYMYSFTTFDLDENPFHILEALRSRREKMAIIIDGEEKFTGIVTIEDILEELVGEIYDETDVEEDGVYQMDEDTFILNSNVKIKYWVSSYASAIKFSEEDSELTIEKWIRKLKGTKPEIGESFTYKNIIIWVKEDKHNNKKFAYEIDII